MQLLTIIDREKHEVKHYEDGKCRKIDLAASDSGHRVTDWFEATDDEIAKHLNKGYRLFAVSNSELFFVKEVDPKA